MSDLTLSTIISVLQNLTYTVVFLLCAGVSYLTLQQPRVKQWLTGAGTLVNVILFIILAGLLYQAASPIISDLFALPHGLISSTRGAGFTASARCLSGVLVLAGLAVGSWRLVGEKKVHDEKE